MTTIELTLAKFPNDPEALARLFKCSVHCGRAGERINQNSQAVYKDNFLIISLDLPIDISLDDAVLRLIGALGTTINELKESVEHNNVGDILVDFVLDENGGPAQQGSFSLSRESLNVLTFLGANLGITIRSNSGDTIPIAAL